MKTLLSDGGTDIAATHAERVWFEFLAVLQALAPEAQAAFVLHEVFETSYVDIARLIGQPVDVCRLHVEHARARAQALRPRLAETINEVPQA